MTFLYKTIGRDLWDVRLATDFSCGLEGPIACLSTISAIGGCLKHGLVSLPHGSGVAEHTARLFNDVTSFSQALDDVVRKASWWENDREWREKTTGREGEREREGRGGGGGKEGEERNRGQLGRPCPKTDSILFCTCVKRWTASSADK